MIYSAGHVLGDEHVVHSHHLRLDCHVYVPLRKRRQCLRFSSFLIVSVSSMLHDRSYVCNAKKTRELFTSTLNGIAASVRCVSSIIVILNAKLPGLFQPCKQNYDVKRRTPTTVPFLLVDAHKH